MSKRVFITGGAGYVGTMLVRKLLAEGYTVDSFDLMLFGNTLPKNSKLKIYEGDIRDEKKLEASLKENTDIFIHLACISNDPSFELNPKLGKSINYDCFPTILDICKKKISRDLFMHPLPLFMELKINLKLLRMKICFR